MKGKLFFSEKFIPASLPEVCAPRHELLNLYYKASDKRLIFVFAAAGCGKTVSALLWLERVGRKTIWIGLDRYDNDPAVFFKLFCTGLLSAQPDNNRMIEILISSTFASSPVEHTISFLSELTPDNNLYAIVLDDMHHIQNKEIQKSLSFIIKRLPMSYITLFLARYELPYEYAQHLENGRAALITASELAFSIDEIQKYFAATGCPILPEEAAVLHTKTGGWAIGVNALAKAGQLELGKSGGQVLSGYIKTQLWDKWEDKLRTFLLKTSILDEMDTALCAKLTGRKDSGKVLDKLYRENAFVSKLSDETFRYHHLFLDFLRDMLELDDTIDKSALNQTAGDYYFGKRTYAQAIKHYIACNNLQSMIPVLDNLNEYGAHSCSVNEHLSNMAVIDFEELADRACHIRPFLFLRCAWKCHLLGRAKDMCRYFDRFYEIAATLGLNPEDYIYVAIGVTIMDHRKPLKELLLAVKKPDYSPSTDMLKNIPTFTNNLPFIYRGHRDYSEFALDLDNMIQLFSDGYGRILGSYNQVFEYQIRAEILYEKNKLKEAVQYAKLSCEKSDKLKMSEFSFFGKMILVAIYQAAGDSSGIVKQTENIKAFIKTDNLEYLTPNFLALKTKIQLLDGNKAAASAWLEHYFVTEPEQLELYKIFQYFITVRAYIVLDLPDKAASFISGLKKLSIDFRRPLDVAEAGVLQAVLEWALGNRKEAQNTLEAALTLMQPFGFIRVFADEGAAILPILKKIRLKADKESYLDPQQSLYLHEVTLAAYEQSKHYKGLTINLNTKPVKLSKQQKNILILLAKGYKYTEIMKATGLTIHTVKSHASAAYTKLEVNNSMDAVLKARELGLIE